MLRAAVGRPDVTDDIRFHYAAGLARLGDQAAARAELDGSAGGPLGIREPGTGGAVAGRAGPCKSGQGGALMRLPDSGSPSRFTEAWANLMRQFGPCWAHFSANYAFGAQLAALPCLMARSTRLKLPVGLVVLASCLLCAAAWGQQPPPPRLRPSRRPRARRLPRPRLRAVGATVAPGALPATPPASQVSPNYLIGPGDTLQIFVWRNPELSTTSRCVPTARSPRRWSRTWSPWARRRRSSRATSRRCWPSSSARRR